MKLWSCFSSEVDRKAGCNLNADKKLKKRNFSQFAWCLWAVCNDSISLAVSLIGSVLISWLEAAGGKYGCFMWLAVRRSEQPSCWTISLFPVGLTGKYSIFHSTIHLHVDKIPLFFYLVYNMRSFSSLANWISEFVNSQEQEKAHDLFT